MLNRATTDDERPFAERAGEWAAGLTYGEIPPAVRRAARAQVHSTLGAALWSLELPVGQQIARTVRAEHGHGDPTPSTRSSSVERTTVDRTDGGTEVRRKQVDSMEENGFVSFLPGGRTTVRGACYGHAALSMALDFDDSIFGGHTGHSAVFVPLAVAEAAGATGRLALTAIVAANEVSGRVGAAAAIGPLRDQEAAYVHAVAAAVGRAVVERADEDTVADAIALALGHPPWPVESSFVSSDTKVTSAADPILTGLTAVTQAREGFTANREVVEADGGFLDTFADRPLPELLTGFDDRWHSRALTVKAVPGATPVVAPVEAALELRRRLDDRDAVTITDVMVEGSLFCTELDDRASHHDRGPDSPLAALNASIPYNVAAALETGEHTPRQFTSAALGDSTVWKLADRVTVEHDDSFTMTALRSEIPLGVMVRRLGPMVVPYAVRTLGPVTALRNLPTLVPLLRKRPVPDDLGAAEERLGARVTVRLSSGETLSETVDHPTGFAGKPLAEVRATARKKFRRAIEARGGRVSDSKRAADAVSSLDKAATVSLSGLS